MWPVAQGAACVAVSEATLSACRATHRHRYYPVAHRGGGGGGDNARDAVDAPPRTLSQLTNPPGGRLKSQLGVVSSRSWEPLWDQRCGSRQGSSSRSCSRVGRGRSQQPAQGGLASASLAGLRTHYPKTEWSLPAMVSRMSL
ncbi:unnamed protein product [Lampetra planeri]